jgi:hypothetical protein
MIKEFEVPFLYKTSSNIEEKIKSSSANLFQNKIRLISLFLLYNAYFITAYMKKKSDFQILKEALLISPVIFCLFFFHTKT